MFLACESILQESRLNYSQVSFYRRFESMLGAQKNRVMLFFCIFLDYFLFCYRGRGLKLVILAQQPEVIAFFGFFQLTFNAIHLLLFSLTENLIPFCCPKPDKNF